MKINFDTALLKKENLGAVARDDQAVNSPRNLCDVSRLSAFVHAPSFCFVSSRLSLSSTLTTITTTNTASSSVASSVRIAVVGDVHDDWNIEEDTKARQLLQVILVMRMLSSSESVADLKFPKAVILGNHDSWFTQQFSQKRKDGVQLQLECLGEEHVGDKCLDFPTLRLSVVGGRPCGGDQLFRKKLLFARYGVQDMNESAMRIYNKALGTPEGHLVIFLAHNGPTGRGSYLSDICGKDWGFGGGDHGDPDLAQAITHLKETTKLNIPLVVFGHMHKELAYGNGLRKMIVFGTDKTIYLNGAIVPRVKRVADEQEATNRSSMDSKTSQFTLECRGTKRAFTLVEILEGSVDKISEIWVSVTGDVTSVEEEHILFKSGN